MTELTTTDGSSPFDRIKQTRGDGSDFWSARALQALMGYARWANMSPAIARAQQAASNTGMDVAREFSLVAPVPGSRKGSGQFGSGSQEDYELSRQAAYLVAMNGDPNKTEVAQAQAYFAEQTMRAELVEQAGGAVVPVIDGALQAAQVIAIFASAQIGDAGFWDAKARQLTGRLLGETPEYDQTTKPLTVSIYLAGRGVNGRDLKALAGTFGKRVKAAYVLEHGEEPPSIEDMVGRHMVQVAQYRESHRPLFDSVWQQYYADAA